MTEDTVVELRQPGTFLDDPLTEVLRAGAECLVAESHGYFDNASYLHQRENGPSRV